MKLCLDFNLKSVRCYSNSCKTAIKPSSKIIHQEAVTESYIYLSHAMKGKAYIRKYVENVRNMSENLKNILCFYNIFTSRGVQPMVRWQPHAAKDGDECSPTQNHKFT